MPGTAQRDPATAHARPHSDSDDVDRQIIGHKPSLSELPGSDRFSKRRRTAALLEKPLREIEEKQALKEESPACCGRLTAAGALRFGRSCAKDWSEASPSETFFRWIEIDSQTHATPIGLFSVPAPP